MKCLQKNRLARSKLCFDDAAVPQLTDLVRTLAPGALDCQRVIGWFMHRSGTWLVPSLRDRAVCAALPSLLALMPGGQVQAPYHKTASTCFCVGRGANLCLI